MSTRHERHWDPLVEFVPSVMEKRDIPGAVVGILDEGEVRTAGLGVTNVDYPLPVTDETLFQIGSITKTFTATAMMRLVEMGELALDATVRTYIPYFKVADETASSQATIRHLLTHMGGWFGDFFQDTGSGVGVAFPLGATAAWGEVAAGETSGCLPQLLKSITTKSAP